VVTYFQMDAMLYWTRIAPMQSSPFMVKATPAYLHPVLLHPLAVGLPAHRLAPVHVEAVRLLALQALAEALHRVVLRLQVACPVLVAQALLVAVGLVRQAVEVAVVRRLIRNNTCPRVDNLYPRVVFKRSKRWVHGFQRMVCKFLLGNVWL
jgi:hypothetical protein